MDNQLNVLFTICYTKTMSIQTTKKAEEKKISVCDVMKSNTSKSIKKLESQIPTLVQQYSDLYASYLHSLDDVFGTCYISEKEFFDKLGFDQKTLKAFQDYSETLTNLYSAQVDAASSFLRSYVKMKMSQIESYDKFMHAMMNSYSGILSQINSSK